MTGWIIGYIVGAVVVAVVVVVLLGMIIFARRTVEKVDGVVDALHASRDGTAALWQVQTTVSTVERIVDAAASTRRSLTPGGRE